MSKIQYDEFDDEMNPMHPCTYCGCEDMQMNWDTGLYECASCGQPLVVQQERREKRRLVKRFRGNEEDESNW